MTCLLKNRFWSSGARSPKSTSGRRSHGHAKRAANLDRRMPDACCDVCRPAFRGGADAVMRRGLQAPVFGPADHAGAGFDPIAGRGAHRVAGGDSGAIVGREARPAARGDASPSARAGGDSRPAAGRAGHRVRSAAAAARSPAAGGDRPAAGPSGCSGSAAASARAVKRPLVVSLAVQVTGARVGGRSSSNASNRAALRRRVPFVRFLQKPR